MKSKPSPQSQRRRQSKLIYQLLEDRNLLSANSPSEDLAELLRQTESGSFLQQQDVSIEILAEQQGEVAASLVQQTLRGLPVFGSYLTVSHLTSGELNVAGQGAAGLLVQEQPDAIRPGLAAQTLAVEHWGQAFEKVDSHLVWNVDGNAASLAWQVNFWQEGRSGDDLPSQMVLVDAFGDEVLHQEASATIQQLFYNPETRIGEFERIVINDTIGPGGSQDYADPFDAVVALPGCTGTLIASDVVVSARHCGSGVGDVIRFGEDSSSPIFTATVTAVELPDGNGTLLDGGDINILTLDQDIPENIAVPMRLIDFTDELEGMVASTIGYGLNGVGSTGHQFSSDGLRWGGQNIIDVYGTAAGTGSGANIISTDFDDGTAGTNTIPGSNTTPLEFEATTAPGDSGGPILVQLGSEWVIAGVLSGGTTNTSVYGDISWWTGVAPYRSQLEATGGTFYFDGTVSFDSDAYALGGNVVITVEDAFARDSVEVILTSSAGDEEIVSLPAAGGDLFVGSINIDGGAVVENDGQIQVGANGTITVTYGVDAFDEATIQTVQGTNGDDIIIVTLDEGIEVNINGEDLDKSELTSGSIDALGGFDRITIFDNLGDDQITAQDHIVELLGEYSYFASNVESVTVVSRGGQDTARLHGTDGDEFFLSNDLGTRLTGSGFDYGTSGVERVFVFGGEGFDAADLGDTPGDDQFSATEIFANVRNGSNIVNVRDFDRVVARSTMGGFDTANLAGTAGDEALIATPTLARIELGDVETEAHGFNRLVARGNGGNDRATFLGGDQRDVFNSRQFISYLFGDGYFNQVLDYSIVNAVGNGGDDLALMFDSPSDDRFYATPTFAAMSNSQFRTRATDFDFVSVTGSAGFDQATFVDSAGDDRYVARPTEAFMFGEDYFFRALSFNRVTATSQGGFDRALLVGSVEDNRFYGSQQQSYITGSTFQNTAENFRVVDAQFTGLGFNIGTFVDSEGDDTFVGRDNRASLYNDDYLVTVTGIDRAVAQSINGGVDQLFANLADYEVFEFGDWI